MRRRWSLDQPPTTSDPRAWKVGDSTLFKPRCNSNMLSRQSQRMDLRIRIYLVVACAWAYVMGARSISSTEAGQKDAPLVEDFANGNTVCKVGSAAARPRHVLEEGDLGFDENDMRYTCTRAVESTSTTNDPGPGTRMEGCATLSSHASSYKTAGAKEETNPCNVARQQICVPTRLASHFQPRVRRPSFTPPMRRRPLPSPRPPLHSVVELRKQPTSRSGVWCWLKESLSVRVRVARLLTNTAPTRRTSLSVRELMR